MPTKPDIIPPARPARTLAIKGLIPSLPERGKIKIGSKGAEMSSKQGVKFQPPMKLDHFVITTLDRGTDGNFKRDEAIHATLGDKPTEIPVRLLYDDPALNFPTRYACFKGRVLWCSGDGEVAQRQIKDTADRESVHCPCHRQDPAYEGNDKCKINGALSALIDGAGGLGGVWKFRTTSYNSVVGILSTLQFMRSITGGPLANIPMKLRVQPKQVSDPRGRQQTVYIVGLEFDGDIPALQSLGHQIALDRAKTHLSIEHIETEARRLLLSGPDNVPLQGDDLDDVVDEFYPQETMPEAPARPLRADFIEVPPEGTAAEQDAAVESSQEIDESDGGDIEFTAYDHTGETVLQTIDADWFIRQLDELFEAAAVAKDLARFQQIAANNNDDIGLLPPPTAALIRGKIAVTVEQLTGKPKRSAI